MSKKEEIKALHESECFRIPEYTWWEKTRRYFFPARFCEVPEAPSRYTDCLILRTVTDFSLADRLRVVMTGRIVMEHKVVTENVIGATVTASVCWVGHGGS